MRLKGSAYTASPSTVNEPLLTSLPCRWHKVTIISVKVDFETQYWVKSVDKRVLCFQMTKNCALTLPSKPFEPSPPLPGPCSLLQRDWLADRESADYRLSSPARVISGGAEQPRSQACQGPSEEDQGGYRAPPPAPPISIRPRAQSGSTSHHPSISSKSTMERG